MPKRSTFYSVNEEKKPADKRVHHNNSACPPGRDIPANERRSGTNNYRLCDDCKKKTNFNVLLIDSHPTDALKIKTFLEQTVLEQNAEPSYRVWHYNSLAQALTCLKEKTVRIDVILLDVFINDSGNPKDIYQTISQAAQDTPIIVITAKASHAQACEAVSEGASAIIVRERFTLLPDRLRDSIEFSIIRNKLLTELKKKSAAEAWEHKRILHWMTGGYSVEAEKGPVVETVKGKKR